MLHRLRQSRTLHTLTSGPISGVHFTEKRVADYCAISRLINQEAIWFWTFQNTYYALSSARLKGLPKLYSGVIDVSNVWLE